MFMFNQQRAKTMATPEPLTRVILLMIAGLPFLGWACWTAHKQYREMKRLHDELHGRE